MGNGSRRGAGCRGHHPAMLTLVLGLGACAGDQLEMVDVDEYGEEQDCVYTGNPADQGGPTADPGWSCGDREPALLLNEPIP